MTLYTKVLVDGPSDADSTIDRLRRLRSRDRTVEQVFALEDPLYVRLCERAPVYFHDRKFPPPSATIDIGDAGSPDIVRIESLSTRHL